MDWAGWALFGLLATTALTAVMIAAQLAGLTRLDLPLILGTLVTGTPTGPGSPGSSSTWSSVRSSPSATPRVFALLDQATWWLGGLLGLLHVAVALTVLVPLLAGVHPRMASHRAGPATPPCWSRRACSASTTAPRRPLVAIAAHLVYGIALGAAPQAR